MRDMSGGVCTETKKGLWKQKRETTRKSKTA